MLRSFMCWALLAVTPASLMAADANAMLYGKGTVLRNGIEIPNSSAIFSGDLLETRANSVANLNSLGTRVIVLPASLVEFQGQSLAVEHGSVSVATSHGISVHVGCMTIAPTSSAWTQFDVTDVNGTVQVAARKNDVRLETTLDSGSKTEVAANRGGNLREGEQTTREESDGCKPDKRKREAGGAAPAGSGGILSSEYVRYGGLAALGGVGIWLALDNDDPASPSKP